MHRRIHFCKQLGAAEEGMPWTCARRDCHLRGVIRISSAEWPQHGAGGLPSLRATAIGCEGTCMQLGSPSGPQLEGAKLTKRATPTSRG